MKPFYRFSWKVVRLLFRVFFGFETHGEEKVPREGPVILASNHRSYFDPPLIGVSVNREVHFMAKSELFSFSPFGRLITALNAHPVKRGQKDTTAVEGMIELLKKGKAVVIFPEGTRNREGKGLGRVKSGIARLAKASGAPIMIVYVQGSRNKWKAFFRIDPVHVYFGRLIEPWEYQGFEANPKGFRALAKHVLEEIGGLMKEVEGMKTRTKRISRGLPRG